MGTHARCGINFAHAWQQGGLRGYASPQAAAALRDLAGLQLRSVALTGFGWLESLHDSRVKWEHPPPGGETVEAIRGAAASARAARQTLMMKPHLWVHGGAWQAELTPDPATGGWPAWFESYTRFIVAQADLAAALHAEWFVVGNELGSATAADPDAWRRLIATVRQHYHGKLTYAANWDEAERITFWGDLDAIGVNFYAPLATAAGASEEQMRTEAARWLARYEALSERVGRSLLLTEVGFRNRAGTAAAPHAWPEHAPADRTHAGDAEQAQAYRAILSTFGRSERVEAIYWWKAFSDPSTDEEGETGFSPVGKPAAQELLRACPR